MNKILILFAHPALQKSRINKILIKGIETIDAVTFHDLYQAYPELDIDVEHEKKLDLLIVRLERNTDLIQDMIKKEKLIQET